MVKNIIKICESVIIALGIVAVAILLLASSSLFNLVRIRYVSTGSMSPKIKVASLVLIVKTDTSKLKIGDIINFLPSGQTISVTHRIAAIKTSGKQISFITKGDANKIDDLDPVPASSVIGKVVLAVPYLGYFYTWIKTPVGFAVAVIIPALYIIISEFLNIKKIIEEQAIEKYKKTSKNTKIIAPVLIFFLFSAVSIKTLLPTYSYFSDGKVLANNTFSTGIWAPSPTPTPTATPTPTPTSTPTPTPTPTVTPSPTATPTPTCPPRPTATPSSIPTPTPTSSGGFCWSFDSFFNLFFDFPGMKNMISTFIMPFVGNFGNNDSLNYQLVYTSRGIPKGISGKITPGFDFDHDFYLGTCSSGGHCTRDLDIGQTAAMTFTGHYCNHDFNWTRIIKLFE